MDEMETEIKLLNRKVNFLIVLSAVGTLVTVVKMLLALPHTPNTPPTNTNSVQIGGTNELKPQREYLSTEEVAEREGVSARTILSYIDGNRVSPQPTRQGRAWVISADYRILPQTAAETAQNNNNTNQQ